jgi:uncharacterized protein YndB with AHSA1/START domain
MKPLVVTTPSDREIVVTRQFNAPRAMVFDCWTKPELLKRWYGAEGWDLTHCEMDLRVGGKWRFVSRGPNGMEMGSGGIVRELSPPGKIVTTEKYDADWTGGETIVTNVLTEKDGITTMTITVLYATKEARDGALKTPMAKGMEMGFQRMEKTLATLTG